MGNVTTKARKRERSHERESPLKGKHSTKTRGKAQRIEKEASSSSATEVTSSTSKSTNSTDSYKYQKYFQNEPLPEEAPPEIKMIRQYLYDKDSFNYEGMQKATDGRCTMFFIDSEFDFHPRDFLETLKSAKASFSNLHFFWKCMNISGVDADTGCTVVTVTDYYGTGKHDGVPYGFGPYEEIPATGITVKIAPIKFEFFVKDGKVMKMVIDADGEIVGPPGFYTQIGGVIPGL